MTKEEPVSVMKQLSEENLRKVKSWKSRKINCNHTVYFIDAVIDENHDEEIEVHILSNHGCEYFHILNYVQTEYDENREVVEQTKVSFNTSDCYFDSMIFDLFTYLEMWDLNSKLIEYVGGFLVRIV